LGLLWLVAFGTGWWVHRRRRPSRAWRARLHAGLARLTLPYALVMGVSGAWLGLETLPALLDRAQDTHPQSIAPDVPPPQSALRPSDTRGAELLAQRRLPGSRVSTLIPPAAPNERWLAALDRTSPWLVAGAVELELPGPKDTQAQLYLPSGRLHVTSALEAVHVGSFAGHAGVFEWPLRVLWALLGLTPAVIACAGLCGTYRRRRARARVPHVSHPLPGRSNENAKPRRPLTPHAA
jgi:hypothetical protein